MVPLLAYGPMTAGACPVPLLSLVGTGLVSVLAALELVISSAARARLSVDLSRRFSALERRMVARKTPTQEVLHAAWDERLAIEEDEPPVLRVLDILCHNELVQAMGYDLKYLYVVPAWRRWLAPLMNVRSEDLKPRGDQPPPAGVPVV